MVDSYLDPTRAAALEGMRGGGGPQQMPPQAGMQPGAASGAAPGGQENEVAMHLAMVIDVLMRDGPLPEYGSAIQQFIETLKQLLSGAVQEPAPQGQAMGMQGGMGGGMPQQGPMGPGAAMPPQPRPSNIPLPPR